MARPPKVKRLSTDEGIRLRLGRFSSYHKKNSITNIRRLFCGPGALLVRCGDFIYNVTREPSIYEMAE